MNSLQKETGDLVTWDMQKAEIPRSVALVFTSKCSSHAVQASEGKGSEWENEGHV